MKDNSHYLLEKYRRQKDILTEMDKIIELVTDQVGYQSDEESDGNMFEAFLQDTNYQNLCNEFDELEKEIALILIESKYAPFIGVPTDIVAELVERHQKKITKLKPKLTDGGIVELKIPDFPNEEALEAYLALENLRNRDEMMRRVVDLNPLPFSFVLSWHTKKMYRQITQCYTYGLFDACCILCRATAEAVSKAYIESQGLGDLLVESDRKSKKFTISGILEERLHMQKKDVKEYKKISSKADHILHNRKCVGQKDALDAITSLVGFLNAFPRVL